MLTQHIAGRVYNYSYSIGRLAVAGDGFLFPVDLALGSGGSLYVVNRGHELNSCQGLTKCTLNHELIWEDRGLGFGNGQTPWPDSWPTSVALDSKENVYVSDEFANLVLIFDKDGNFLVSWGEKGSGEGELNGPSGLAFDREDNLYMVDSLNHRVQKFTKDGKFLSAWGSHGSGQGHFNMPWGISIDREGNVYVADWGNHRVQKLTPQGEYLASFGHPGTGDGELYRPASVAIDSEGDVYVADWGNNRLNIYSPDGAFITAFLGDAEELSPWALALLDANPDYLKARQRVDLTPERLFARPVAVNVDNEGRIIVAEAARYRIQVYVKERDFVDAQFNL